MPTEPKPKKSDVSSVTAEFMGVAECANTSCAFQASGRDSRQSAKDHAFYHPGHEVLLTKKTVTSFLLKKEK